MVLISGALASGGVETHVRNLCAAIPAGEASFTLFGGQVAWSRESLALVKNLGVRVVAPHLRRTVFQKAETLLRVYRLRREKFDNVVFLGSSRFHAHLLRSTRSGTFTIYNEIMHYPNPYLEALVRRMDGLIAGSRFIETQLRQRFPGIPVRKLTLLANYSKNGISRQAEPVGQRQLRLLFLGRLVEDKRPDWLIRRWQEFAAHPPVAPARLDIVGSGKEQFVRRMEAAIRQQGLENLITLHGSCGNSALDDVFGQADLVLNPSMYEGLGLVLLEAMQRGVPVVATEAGGSAELAEGNPDSIFTSGNDWDAFCAGVRDMAARLRSGLVSPTRLHRWVETHYGKEVLLRQWQDALLNPRQFFGVRQLRRNE
jgi:glycosyltransferase involved in cell wall biosynthesis